MDRQFKKILSFLIALIITFSCCITVGAEPYYGYENLESNDSGQDTVKAPAAYTVDTVLKELKLSRPEDMYVRLPYLYILDTGNGRVLQLDEDFNTVNIIVGFSENGSEDNFIGATGIYVDNQYNIYIADKQNGRILELDKDGKLLRKVMYPVGIDAVKSDYKFSPSKLVVNRTGRIYAISEGTYDGLILIENDDSFGGFLGANRVKTNFWTSLWKKLLSKKQTDAMQSYVPVELSNIDMDADDFVYATAKGDNDNQMLRKFNLNGNDVLTNENTTVWGDVSSFISKTDNTSASYFVDVAIGENGIYSCLDLTRGKIFTYDESGNQLFVFGSISSRDGGFINPICIDYFDDKILVLDNGKETVTVFKKTEYAQYIHNAVSAFSDGNYDAAFENWENVLRLNTNCKIAYIGVGRAYMRNGDYKTAMKYFTLGGNRKLYSKAFVKQRAIQFEKSAPIVFIAAGAITSVFIIFFIIKNYKKLRKQLKDGAEIRNRKKGVK